MIFTIDWTFSGEKEIGTHLQTSVILSRYFQFSKIKLEQVYISQFEFNPKYLKLHGVIFELKLPA